MEKIRKGDYVLPAIQREFVWKPEKICALFDSLMRGYPIGSFLFWNVEQKSADKYTFYNFLRKYHEKTNRHCPQADLVGGKEVTAILDGQQRLTSLNVGLRGTYAKRVKYGHHNDPDAYPAQRLYLTSPPTPPRRATRD